MFNHNCQQNDFNKLKMFANKNSLNYRYKITSKINQTILNGMISLNFLKKYPRNFHTLQKMEKDPQKGRI
jgi:hypothetical protein